MENIPDKITIINSVMKNVFNNGYDINVFHLTKSLIDRYLVRKKVETRDFKVTCLVCLMIVSKVEEFSYYQTKQIKVDTEFQYSDNELVELEADILRTINFKIHDYTLIDDIRKIYSFAKPKKEEKILSAYLSCILLFNNNYPEINLSVLSNKIVKFASIVYSETIDSNLITSDPDLMFIYLQWKKLYSVIPPHINYPGEHHVLMEKLNIGDIGDIIPVDIFIANPNAINCHITNSIMYHPNLFYKAQKVRNVGKGAYGTVNHIIIDNKEIALKSNLNSVPEIGIDVSILREIYFLGNLDHPSIIKMDGVYYDHRMETAYVGLDLMRHTIRERMKRPIDLPTKMKYIIQMLLGIEYLHDNSICHRDLSSHNIMIDNDDNIKIIDFGLAKHFHGKKCDIVLSQNVCALFCRSIELLVKKPKYNHKIDVWSAACIIYLILAEEYLFIAYTETAMTQEIYKILGIEKKETDYIVDSIPFSINSQFKSRVNPAKGIGLVNIQDKFPLHTKILYQMLEYSPEKRISISEALAEFRKLV